MKSEKGTLLGAKISESQLFDAQDFGVHDYGNDLWLIKNRCFKIQFVYGGRQREVFSFHFKVENLFGAIIPICSDSRKVSAVCNLRSRYCP